MAKVILVESMKESGTYAHWCEGCGGTHWINTTERNSLNAIWKFNKDVNVPTFHPSIKITAHEYCCHYFIKAGVIQYQSDCTHKLAGQDLQLKDMKDEQSHSQ